MWNRKIILCYLFAYLLPFGAILILTLLFCWLSAEILAQLLSAGPALHSEMLHSRSTLGIRLSTAHL